MRDYTQMSSHNNLKLTKQSRPLVAQRKGSGGVRMSDRQSQIHMHLLTFGPPSSHWQYWTPLLSVHPDSRSGAFGKGCTSVQRSTGGLPSQTSSGARCRYVFLHGPGATRSERAGSDGDGDWERTKRENEAPPKAAQGSKEKSKH